MFIPLALFVYNEGLYAEMYSLSIIAAVSARDFAFFIELIK